MRTIKKLSASALLLLFTARQAIYSQMPEVEINNIESIFQKYGQAFLNILFIGMGVWMTVRLVGAINEVQKAKTDSYDKAIGWGAGLVFCIVGVVLINLFVNQW